MKQIVGLFLFLAFSCISQGQMIDNRDGNTFGESPFFHPEFVQRNKIKSITGSISTKQERKVIVDKKREVRYEFNKTGLQNHYYTTFWTGGLKDTAFILYHYDQKNRLLLQRKNDLQGYFSRTYELDEKGRVLRSTYSRDENAGADRYHFELKNQTIINQENYSWYSPEEKKEVQVFYNSYGKKYKEITSSYDENAYLLERYTSFVVNSNYTRITYEYNEKGYVSLKSEESKMGSFQSQKSLVYKYDDLGNLISEDVYRNQKHTTHKEFLYNSRMLLSSQLVQSLATRGLTIYRYTYEFYP